MPYWSRTSLIFLLLIAMIGTSLRGVAFYDLPFSFDFLRHSHSHVAFQGWIYTLLMVILIHEFVPAQRVDSKKYHRLFVMSSFVIVGILVAFAWQGYGFYSILFSSLFQVLCYWFTIRFFKDAKKSHCLSLLWIKTGLWLGIVSSIAPWFIGVVSAKGLAGSELYESLIYFFLHFQYNGWFLFITIGLFYLLIEQSGFAIKTSSNRRFYWLWLGAVFPAYGLSLLGLSFNNWARVPALMAVILQVLALIYFIPTVISYYRAKITNKQFWIKCLLILSFCSFMFKSTLQTVSVFPQVQDLAFGSRNIVMAYMHLSLIGVLTFFLIGWLLIKGWIPNHIMSRVGLALLTSGFVVTELLLALSGLGWFHSYLGLFLFSTFMAVGIGFIVIAAFLKPIPSNPPAPL